MASWFVRRTRHTAQSPRKRPGSAKLDDQTPETIARISSTTNKDNDNLTDRCKVGSSRVQRPTGSEVLFKPSLLSQQDLFHLENLSSSCNESSLMREKIPNNQFNNEKSGKSGQNDRMSPQAACCDVGEGRNRYQCAQKNYLGEKQWHKKNHHQTLAVPYRKCHSATEEKVVGIINKIKAGKDCDRQIQTLLERARKIPTKELSNKYYISGLHVIWRLAQEIERSENQTTLLVSKIEEVLSEVSRRIIEELDSTKYFDCKPPRAKIVCSKEQLIRKAYKIMRKNSYRDNKQAAQEKAISLSSEFIEHTPYDFGLFCTKILTV